MLRVNRRRPSRTRGGRLPVALAALVVVALFGLGALDAAFRPVVLPSVVAGPDDGAASPQLPADDLARAIAPEPVDATDRATDRATDAATDEREPRDAPPGRASRATEPLRLRVVFPPGTPVDERASLYLATTAGGTRTAAPIPIGADGLVVLDPPRATGASRPDTGALPRDVAAELVRLRLAARSRSDDEATPVPVNPYEPNDRSWIDVQGRFVFLPEPLAFDLSRASTGAEILVRPELGGRLAGELRGDRELLALLAAEKPALVIEGDSIRRRWLGHATGLSFNRQGRFDHGPLPCDGPVVLSLESVHALPFRLEVELVPGRTLFRPLVLERGVTVAGTVLGSHGPLVARAVVIERADPDRGWIAIRSERSDRHGRFEIGGLEPGRLRVRLESDLMVADPVDLGPRGAGARLDDVELNARLGERIDGWLVDVDGAPVVGAVVVATELVDGDADPRPSGPSKRATTHAEGRFTLLGLRSGEYLLTAAHERADGPFHARLRTRSGTGGLTLALRAGELPDGPAVGPSRTD